MNAPATLSIDRVKSFVKSSSFLGGLPDEVLDQLVKRGHTVRFRKGETIYQRGDDGNSLMVILSGRVKISNVTADAKEVALNFLGAGDINGEIAALDGGARTATAAALEDTEAFVLYRRDLMPVLASHPEALIEIVQVLCEKLRVASEQVEDSVRDMPARMSRGLQRLMRQHGRKTARGVLIDLKLTQRDLGTYTGLSRENVSRQLGALKDGGVIDIDGGDITIRDENKLEEISLGDGG